MKKLTLSLCAAIVASVTAASALAQDRVGDPHAGEKKNPLCVGCHGITGYHTGFPEVHKVPKISGQSQKYIVNALKAYKSGERKHPSMRGVAANLTEQDMADLAAYYANNGRLLPEPEKAVGASDKAHELITKGGCTTCHGDNFSKPMDPSYPKISGQHPDYLYFALKAYKTEGVNLIGRNNAIMSGVAKQFTNAELKVLADYVGSLPGQLQTVQRDRIRN